MIFYTPDISSSQYTMNEEESGHAIRVLRMKAGDELTLVDGHGGYYHTRITQPHPKHCEVEVITMQQEYGKRPYHLHIGIAPTKNTDRFEWFVEKSVEIGIDEITPLLCEHSERKQVNLDRIQRIMAAAMKQSKKAYLPVLHEMTTFEKWVKSVSADTRLIAYCGEEAKQPVAACYQAGKNVAVAIGPEGDFSAQEVTQALAGQFSVVSLGDSRLRTETAGVVACHSIYFINGL